MCAYAMADDWSPLIRLNRDFHLKIFSLSPHKLILEEVKRLWALADLFISTKNGELASEAADRYWRTTERARKQRWFFL